MLIPGLVSVTFRNLPATDVIRLVVEAGLKGIEWSGNCHVLHGDREAAREVKAMTARAGLQVAAYGSYYRVGGDAVANPVSFEDILDTAVELGAGVLRVWAGHIPSADLSPVEREAVMADMRRINALAAARGVQIATEFHDNSLTDTNESAVQMLSELVDSNFLTNWQPHNGEPTEVCIRGLEAVKARVANVHVFHWWPTWRERWPLSAGEERWMPFLRILSTVPGDRFAMLEFVADDSEKQFVQDAETLCRWLNQL